MNKQSRTTALMYLTINNSMQQYTSRAVAKLLSYVSNLRRESALDRLVGNPVSWARSYSCFLWSAISNNIVSNTAWEVEEILQQFLERWYKPVVCRNPASYIYVLVCFHHITLRLRLVWVLQVALRFTQFAINSSAVTNAGVQHLFQHVLLLCHQWKNAE